LVVSKGSNGHIGTWRIVGHGTISFFDFNILRLNEEELMWASAFNSPKVNNHTRKRLGFLRKKWKTRNSDVFST